MKYRADHPPLDWRNVTLMDLVRKCLVTPVTRQFIVEEHRRRKVTVSKGRPRKDAK